MANMNDFLTQWVQFHPDDFPVSHTLPRTSRDHWIRFHSLSDSKRYADDPHEASIILQRMTTLGDEVLGRGAPAFLVLAYPVPFPESEREPYAGETEDIDVTDPEMARHFRLMAARWQDLVTDTIGDFCLELAWTFRSEDDECNYQIHAAQTLWGSHRDAELLRKIADDEIDRVFWMSAGTGDIFAPYDGGADLILSDPGKLALLRKNYSDWLPDNSHEL